MLLISLWHHFPPCLLPPLVCLFLIVVSNEQSISFLQAFCSLEQWTFLEWEASSHSACIPKRAHAFVAWKCVLPGKFNNFQLTSLTFVFGISSFFCHLHFILFLLFIFLCLHQVIEKEKMSFSRKKAKDSLLRGSGTFCWAASPSVVESLGMERIFSGSGFLDHLFSLITGLGDSDFQCQQSFPTSSNLFSDSTLLQVSNIDGSAMYCLFKIIPWAAIICEHYYYYWGQLDLELVNVTCREIQQEAA